GGGGRGAHGRQGNGRRDHHAACRRIARRLRPAADHRDAAALWHRHTDAALLARLLLPAASGDGLMTTAAVHARAQALRKSKVRQFVTPEGVDLELRIASAGLRLGALVIDISLIQLILLGFTLLMIWALGASQSSIAISIWMLGAFVLRTFWFIGFELGQRAATPGKRLVGIRVVARDGGRLTADAVVARNLIRELEIFLPLTFIGFSAAEEMVKIGRAHV